MTTCSVPECSRPVRSRGLCNPHHLRLLRRGTTDAAKQRYAPGQLCTFDPCERPAFSRGYCRQHYERLRAYGDPAAGRWPVGERPARPKPQPRLPWPERFWAKVEKSDGCWLWTGQKTKAVNGYGRVRVNPERGQGVAHRIAYDLLVGPIPPGLDLDHLCKTRLCVRPDHLEPVTPRENWRRGASTTVAQARQTHCKRGHEFTPENTSRSGGSRRCRTCTREQTNARRAAARA